MQSSRELYQKQIGVEESEIATMPEEEQEELALIYMAKGLPEEEAKQVAARIMADGERPRSHVSRRAGYRPR